MLSYLGCAAETNHAPDCKQIDSLVLASWTCSTLCPVLTSMSYLASALTARPVSAKSMLSFPSTQSSILEESTTEDQSDENRATKDPRSTSVTAGRRSKRSSGSSLKSTAKTVFHLAHPPPVSIHKQHLHIRPRVLLQLQKISDTARPTPVLEVLPSFVFASRLARRFPRTFKGKAGLGADDLVIVSSEDYTAEKAEAGESDGIFEGDRWDKREIVAAICQPGKDEVECWGKAEICVNHGPSWTASRLASGAYEFVSVDEHGLRNVARWVPRLPKTTPRISTDRKFNFSLLKPGSRRHAVIASMDRHSIEVCDQYSDPPLVRRDTNSSTPTISTHSTTEESLSRDPIEVSRSLRALITVTGIYVSFQEGYSSLFKHSDAAPPSPNLGPKHPRRSWSLTSSHFGNEKTRSPTASSFGTLQRPRPQLLHTNSSSAVLEPLSSNQPKIPAPRNSSSGSSFIRRVRSRNDLGFKANQTSGEVERTWMGRESDRISCASSLSSEGTSLDLDEGHALATVPSSGLDIVEENSVVAPIVTKKPRKRLSRMFGLSSRSK